jgi:importin-4
VFYQSPHLIFARVFDSVGRELTFSTAETANIKAATSELRKNYFNHPEALVLLIQIITESPTLQLRQLAAVEARSLVTKHWEALPASQKPELKNRLLQSTLNETAPLVRHSSARVIAAIANIEIPDGEWADLPGYLQQAATSGTTSQREVGVYILFTLLETLQDAFTTQYHDLFLLFNKTIQDPESVEVRINTMLGLGVLASLVDPDEDEKSLAAFKNTFPQMVKVLKEVIGTSDEARIMQAFEVFQTILGCDAAFMASHFKDTLTFMIDIAVETSLDEETRVQAISFLMQAVRYRKLKIQSLKLGEPMTIKMLQVVTEINYGDDDEETSPARSALGLIDMLASALPPSQVVVPLLHALTPYVNNSDADYRAGGILALGMVVEGAPDFLSTQMKDIFPLVMRLLADPVTKVRHAALNTVARLADDLAEDMGAEHATLIPTLLKSLDSVNAQSEDKLDINIITATFHAIDSMADGLTEEQAASYLPELMPRVGRFLNHSNLKITSAAVGAVGSFAAAADEAFKQYFEATMGALKGYVTLKESEEELDLRGIVIDSMGSMAGAVGKEAFQPYVIPLMTASEEGLHLGHPRLRETSYIFWSTMSKVYEEDFDHFLEGVVKGLIESLEQEEDDLSFNLGEEAAELLGQEVTIAGKKVKVADKASASADFEDADEMGDDEDDDDDWDDLTAISAIAMEKEIAIEVIGDVLTHTKSKYLPYFEKTVEVIVPLIEHPYEGVRKTALSTLWRAYSCLQNISEEGGKMAKWVPGLPVKVMPPTELIELGKVIMAGTLAVYPDEIDR